MRKNIFATILLVTLFNIDASFAAANFSYKEAQPQPVNNSAYTQQAQYPQNNTLQGSIVMVPAGATVNATLTAPISSEYTTAGQTVSLSLNKDFYYANKLIAPAGSTIYGTVVEAVKAKHGSINGKLCIRFTQIFTPYGMQVPISAVVKTDDGTGVLVGGTKIDVAKEYTKDLAVGSGAGALSGLVFGALAGGSVGQGAALGTAVGAGGGLVKAVWDKGNDVTIPANASIDILLTQPITVSPTSYQYEN